MPPTIYYVATSDGNDTYTGLAEAYTSGTTGPWKTISHANGRIAAGDTLMVRTGTYHEAVHWTTDGTESDRITIQNYSGEYPVIDGTWTLPVGGVYEFLVKIEADYVTFESIAVQHSAGGLIVLDGTGITVMDVDGDGSMETGMVAGGTGCTFSGCSMTDNGAGMNPESPHYDEAQGTWGSAICTVGADTTIAECVSHDNFGEGINAYSDATYATIYGCTVYDNQSFNLYLDSVIHASVYGNLVYQTKDYDQYGITIGAESHQPSYIDLYNNIVMGCKANFQTDSNVTGWDHIRIMYNTFVNSTGASPYTWGVIVRDDASTWTASIFKDNIVIEETEGRTPILCPASHAGLTFSYNCWNQTPDTDAAGTGDVTADPKIAKAGLTTAGNLTTAYFALDSDSPCIDAGNTVTGITTDIIGTTRPSGDEDIGAFEYEAPEGEPVVYYIKNGGDDDLDGLSDGNAWETISKVNGETFNPDDQVLFKRGSTWRETLTVPSSGTANHPLILGKYGTTGADPIIKGSDLKNTAGNWTQDPTASTFTERIQADADDGSWITGTGLWATGINDAPFGNDGAAEKCYFRFTGVTVPKNATITSAKLTFRCSSNQAGTVNLKVSAEDADNPAAPTTYTDGDGRSITGAVDWDKTGWTSGQDYDSPDLATAVQTVVNRAGWASGQAMQFFVKDDGTGAGVATHVLEYSGSSTTCALLTIEYTSGNSNKWYLSSISADPGILAHDGTLGVRKATKGTLGSAWDYWWDDPNDRFYVYATTNPTTLATNIEVGARDNCVDPNGTSYVTYDGLSFRHSRANAFSVFWGGDGEVIQNCSFTQVSKYGMQFNNGASGSVAGSTFTDWGVIDGQQYAIQAIANGATESGPVDITGCTFTLTQKTNTTESTAVMQDDGGWVRVFSDNTVNGGGFLIGSGLCVWRPASIATTITISGNEINDVSHAGIIVQDLEKNGAAPVVTVRNNIIKGSCLADVLDTEALRLREFTAASDVTVAYNIINGTCDGTNAHHGIQNKGADGSKIWNNVIYGCDNGIEVTDLDADHSTGLDVRNNLVLSNRGYGLNLAASNTITTWGYNCWYGNVSGALNGKAAGTGDVTADPKVTTAGTDFSLQSSSPCRNAGTSVGLTTDYLGNPVPATAGGTPDVGAYEYEATGLPTVTTTAASSIAATSAAGGGNVTDTGDAPVTARGVCWSTSANPTTASSKTSDSTGTGVFTSTLATLVRKTVYHVRAYATNSIGTAYGSDVQFTTLATAPVVTTTAITAITSASATSGGAITDTGGDAITAKGVCWNTSANPTTSNSKTSDGPGATSYASSITGLSESTTYHVRAYATNDIGTSYGADREFDTAVAVSGFTAGEDSLGLSIAV